MMINMIKNEFILELFCDMYYKFYDKDKIYDEICNII